MSAPSSLGALPLCARGAIGGLQQGRLEIVRRVAERDPALAIGRATVGLAIDAAIDDDDIALLSDDLDVALTQHCAGAIEGDHVGRAVTLAGDYHEAARLHGDVGN